MSHSLERWLDNKRSNPLREFSKMEQSMDRLFDEMTGGRRNPSFFAADTLTPFCDISEDSGNYILQFDIPGVTKDQVKVEVDKDQLIVRAERREEKKTEDRKKHLSEVFYGSYMRSFTLPGLIDEKKIDAKFENGVLTVKVPKTESPQTKQIPVS